MSTSANISNQKNPTCFDEIDDTIKNGVDAILEEKTKMKLKIPSQIIKVDIDGKVSVIRK